MYLGSDALVLMILAASDHLAYFAFYLFFPYFSISRSALAGELEEFSFLPRAEPAFGSREAQQHKG
jgi:hypothetical protein